MQKGYRERSDEDPDWTEGLKTSQDTKECQEGMELALAMEDEHFDQVVDRSYDQQGVDGENDCVGQFVLVEGHVGGYGYPDNSRTDKRDQGADDRQGCEQKHRGGTEEIVSDAGR